MFFWRKIKRMGGNLNFLMKVISSSLPPILRVIRLCTIREATWDPCLWRDVPGPVELGGEVKMRPGCWSRNLRGEHKRHNIYWWVYLMLLLFSDLQDCCISVYMLSTFWCFSSAREWEIDRHTDHLLHTELLGIFSAKCKNLDFKCGYSVHGVCHISCREINISSRHRFNPGTKEPIVRNWLWLNKAIKLCNPVIVLSVFKKYNIIYSNESFCIFL